MRTTARRLSYSIHSKKRPHQPLKSILEHSQQFGRNPENGQAAEHSPGTRAKFHQNAEAIQSAQDCPLSKNIANSIMLNRFLSWAGMPRIEP